MELWLPVRTVFGFLENLWEGKIDWDDRKQIKVEVQKMIKKEDKYIVIRKKDLEYLWYRVTLPTLNSEDRGDTYTSPEIKKQLLSDLKALNRLLEGDLGNSNKYILCNQDEPYAELVWQVILGGEALKRGKK